MSTDEVVETVDVDGQSDRAVERVMTGMLVNLAPGYRLVDTKWASEDEAGHD